MAGWPGNGTVGKVRYFGPSPMGRAIQHALDVMQTRGMTAAADLHPRREDKSNPYNGESFRGDPGYALQNFKSTLMGASRGGIRPGFNTLLPGTSALPQAVHDQFPGAPS